MYLINRLGQLVLNQCGARFLEVRDKNMFVGYDLIINT